MKPRNYGAIALLVVFTFFERFAYYGFRSTVFVRLMHEGGMAAARISMVMAFAPAALVVGLMLGGGLSLATRNRFLLAAAALVLALIQGLAAAFPLAGIVLLPVAAGLVRPLVYMAAAEEIDQEGRIWKAVAVGVVIYGANNAGAFFSSLVAPGARELSPALGYAVPVVGAVAAVIPCVVLAFALPGAPFRWGSHEALVVGAQPAPYRPEPAVSRAAGGPSPWILALAIGAMLFSNCAQNAQRDAAFAALERGTESSLRWVTMLNPVIVVFVGVLVASLAGYLASTRSRISPTWPFGAALGAQALSVVISAVAFISFSVAAAMGGAVLDALAEGVAAPIALGYVLGTLSSRWVGVVGAGYGVVTSVAGAAISPLLARREAMIPVLVLSGVCLLVAAVLTLVLGPRLHRGNDPA
jgi:dipeptide/tripeptide permease